MAKTFTKLTRANMKALKPEQKLQEHGIIFTRQNDGDGRFSVCITVDGQRIHRVVGYESDGTTRTQAEEYIAKIKTEAKENRLNLPKGRKLPLSFKEAVKRYLVRISCEEDRDLSKKEKA